MMIWRLGWYNAVWARASSEVINNWTWSQRPTIIYKQLQTAVSALLLVVLVHIWLYLAAAEGSDRRAKNGRENTTCTISDSIGSGRRLSSRQDDWLIWPQYLPGTETHKAYAPRHSPLVLSQQYMATIEICFTEQLKWSEDTRTRCSIVGGLCISIDCQQIFFHVKFLLPWQAVARVARVCSLAARVFAKFIELQLSRAGLVSIAEMAGTDCVRMLAVITSSRLQTGLWPVPVLLHSRCALPILRNILSDDNKYFRTIQMCYASFANHSTIGHIE